MRLSQEEWNKRLEEVKLASEDCKSIKEMAEVTDFNINIINTVLKKFPEDAKQIKENLDSNKKVKKKAKRKIRKPDINKRLEQIILASETCDSMSGISKVTGLSKFIVKNTLSKFPTEAEKVKENLAKNKEESKAEAEENKAKNRTSNNSNDFSFVMLDTSISGTEDIFHILETYVKEGKKLALTDVMLEELANVQKGSTKQAESAREFLYIIMDNLSSFQLFKAKHEMTEKETADEAIIKSCVELDNNVLLLTSDKEMYIKAMLQNVNTRYLPKVIEEREKQLFDLRKKKAKRNIVEFADIFIKNGKAIYRDRNRDNQYIKVFSRNKKEKQGKAIVLEKGDHIFICTAKEDYMTFADYEIYDTTVNKVNMRFNFRIYNCDPVIDFAQPDYKKFAEHARSILVK